MKNIQVIRRLVQCISLVLIVMGVMSGVPAIKVGIIIVCILGGAFYCGWICPFGMLQDIVSKIGRKFGIKKRKIPRGLHMVLSKLRYLIFISVTVFSVSFIFEILSYDPRGNLTALLTGRAVGSMAMGVLILFLLASIFYERVFCNYLCMEGAKYGLMSILRPFTINRDVGKCINCGKCSRVCPMNIEVAGVEQVNSLQCINCFQCISSCPKEETLKFGVRRFGKMKMNKVVIIALAAVLVMGVKFIGGEHENTVDNTPVQEETTSLDGVEADNVVPDNDEKTGITPEKSADVDGQESKVQDTLYKDGTYKGVGKGFKGNMTAEVIIKDDIITKVEVINNVDDRKWFNRANKVIPKDIINKQSAEVDVVSGATYSSKGIIGAVQDALKKAENR